VLALSVFICRFTHYWIGQLAFALFHGKANFKNIDVLMQNALQPLSKYINNVNYANANTL
jgi:hypothetical protein